MTNFIFILISSSIGPIKMFWNVTDVKDNKLGLGTRKGWQILQFYDVTTSPIVPPPHGQELAKDGELVLGP